MNLQRKSCLWSFSDSGTVVKLETRLRRNRFTSSFTRALGLFYQNLHTGTLSGIDTALLASSSRPANSVPGIE